MKMKKIFYWLIALSVVQNVHSQSVEGLIEKYRDRGYVITKVEKDIYKIENKWGDVLNYVELTTSNEANLKLFDDPKLNYPDPQYIYPYELDTTIYGQKYKLWKEIDVSTYLPSDPIVIADANNNGLPEIYGVLYGLDTLDLHSVIYEMDSLKNFPLKYIYKPEPWFVQHPVTIGDINGDGIKDLGVRAGPYTIHHLRFYTGNSINSLPTNFMFISNYLNGLVTNCKILDLDKNGRTNLICRSETYMRIYILEYNPLTNNYDSVFSMRSPLDRQLRTFTVGDFDQDGKGDIFFGSGTKLFMLENVFGREYQIVWETTLPYSNLAYFMVTNDFNKNGKPEFWVGSQFLPTYTYPFLVLWCFESNGDNSYELIHQIYLIDAESWITGYALPSDIDNDGEEELVICVAENFVIILKPKRVEGKYIFEPFYINFSKRFNYFSVNTYDFDNDGKLELTISGDRWRTSPSQAWTATRIYKENFLSSVKNDKNTKLENFRISHSYPNPFNSKTQFKLLVPNNLKSNHFDIRIFNLLGKEIKVLLNQELYSGGHFIEWDGKNNDGYELASGMYFIQVKNLQTIQTIKTILIK
ncbi:MAG: T9SS type A sorting domain-containing protein [Ignavibacteria bacterium]|nr:T9SS type A sorting domain-containing protein [Ignavibacteria bacterium]MBM4176413.1 T9SS type A sorting domain-containing protein [Ignavibacteria bacterium]